MSKFLRATPLIITAGLALSVPAYAYDEGTSQDSGTCRAVIESAEIDGVMQEIAGRACLQSDGTWQIVRDVDGTTLWYPVASYPYTYVDPWWWDPPIFLGVGISFVFVDRLHHFHHFDHFAHFSHFSHIGNERIGGRMPSRGFHHSAFEHGGFDHGGMSEGRRR
ncbi:hypothetical protein [Paraburkholderia bannensis]|uniref:hypothetical protein n=1 Tax=Paraburkholderia bannensis TaxID=765414 RepID=UPI002ABD9B66|nr:hypothetical protein [Paraburkholderia bannensis]